MTDPQRAVPSDSASPSHPRLFPQGTAGPVRDKSTSLDGAGTSVLILACGNDLRRDDGAGLALARQIARLAPLGSDQVTCLCVHQLMPELALDVARPGVRVVLFVDTRAAGADDDGRLAAHPLAANPADPKLGHHLDARTILLYAQELYAADVAAWSVTIPGWDFDHGEGFSPRTQALLDGAGEFVGRLFQGIGDWGLGIGD